MLGSIWLFGLMAAGQSCPYFSEIHADPTLMDDAIGEFFEIAFDQIHGETSQITTDRSSLDTQMNSEGSPPDSTQSSIPDSLQISLGKSQFHYDISAQNSRRLLFCHGDLLAIEPTLTMPCFNWPSTLVNSTALEMVLTTVLCKDSISVPKAVPGKSWSRSSRESPWILSDPTPGFADPKVDFNVVNRSPNVQSLRWLEGFWQVSLSVFPGDTLMWLAKDLAGKLLGQGLFFQDEIVNFPSTWPRWIDLQLNLYGDDFPLDNQWDTLAIPPNQPPIWIREVALCPPEGEGEWWEIENTSGTPIAVSRLSICPSPNTSSLIGSSRTVSLSDSSQVNSPREFLSGRGRAIMSPDVDILKETLDPSTLLIPTPGSIQLRNSADTLILCLDGIAIHQVSWSSANTKQCPSHYLVQGDSIIATNMITPGYQPAQRASNSKPRLSSRWIKLGNPLVMRVDPMHGPWHFQAFDRRGHLMTQSTCSDSECIWHLHGSVFESRSLSGSGFGPILIHAVNALGEKHLFTVILSP